MSHSIDSDRARAAIVSTDEPVEWPDERSEPRRPAEIGPRAGAGDRCCRGRDRVGPAHSRRAARSAAFGVLYPRSVGGDKVEPATSIDAVGELARTRACGASPVRSTPSRSRPSIRSASPASVSASPPRHARRLPRIGIAQDPVRHRAARRQYGDASRGGARRRPGGCGPRQLPQHGDRDLPAGRRGLTDRRDGPGAGAPRRLACDNERCRGRRLGLQGSRCRRNLPGSRSSAVFAISTHCRSRSGRATRITRRSARYYSATPPEVFFKVQTGTGISLVTAPVSCPSVRRAVRRPDHPRR